MATPDILFPPPGVIIPSVSLTIPIRWIDSKAGWIVPEFSIPGKLSSLKRQAAKYEAMFGAGLFVWHRGFVATVCDSTTTNVFHCSLDRQDATGLHMLMPALQGTQTLHSAHVTVASKKCGRIIGTFSGRCLTAPWILSVTKP
jgi:hypothetical protein